METNILSERWEQVSRKIETLAEALPKEKWNWRPSPEVRSCAEVLRHVAFWNQYVADTLRGTRADDSTNELDPARYPDAAAILKALRETATAAAQALREGSDDSASLILPFLEHTSEHYGQLTVYGRLLGVVPPASRT